MDRSHVSDFHPPSNFAPLPELPSSFGHRLTDARAVLQLLIPRRIRCQFFGSAGRHYTLGRPPHAIRHWDHQKLEINPESEKDEACAPAGLAKIQNKLSKHAAALLSAIS